MYSPSQGHMVTRAKVYLQHERWIRVQAVPQTRGVLVLAALASAPIDCNSCRMSPQELRRALMGTTSISQSTALCGPDHNQCQVHAESMLSIWGIYPCAKLECFNLFIWHFTQETYKIFTFQLITLNYFGCCEAAVKASGWTLQAHTHQVFIQLPIQRQQGKSSSGVQNRAYRCTQQRISIKWPVDTLFFLPPLSCLVQAEAETEHQSHRSWIRQNAQARTSTRKQSMLFLQDWFYFGVWLPNPLVCALQARMPWEILFFF